MIEKEPFRKYNLNDSKSDIFSVRLNELEREELNSCKRVLEQEKDSTAYKQLAHIGAVVIHDKIIFEILKTVFENKRKNKRLGVMQFD